MDEANTPKEIADIEASIAAFNQMVHQKVLDGDKQWSVSALSRPCPKVSENLKTPEDFLCKSPKFRQKLTKAVAALVPHLREELLISGKGAPRAKGTINGMQTSMIFDGGSYSNIILLPFLKTLPDVMIAPSDTVFVMANNHKSFSMGTAVHLTLWLGGVWMAIEAAIFKHKQYTLLIDQKIMGNLGVTTRYTNNFWTVKCNGKEFSLSVFFDSSHAEEFLCEPVARSIYGNPWLSPDQKVQLASVVDKFSMNILEDSNNLPKASGFEHKIDTGEACPIAYKFYQLPHSKESFVKSEIQRLLKQGNINPRKSPWSFPFVVVRVAADQKKAIMANAIIVCPPFPVTFFWIPLHWGNPKSPKK
ncbi:hypothetical protein DSO57_1002047 [Entomophthora muscae]|uniref:Uncharacterized protein n=1 Tax=Entomophthora muscae TaxID=34485 RepID=A0ACC2SAZ9_9FUNG|nr:hypothetical protein DSO57_1002047 [Entomophthora muscae]